MVELAESVEQPRSPWDRVSGLFNQHEDRVKPTELGTEQLLLASSNPERPDYWFAVTLRRYPDISESRDTMRTECGPGWHPNDGLLAAEILCLNDRSGSGLQISERILTPHATSTEIADDTGKALSPQELLDIIERAHPIVTKSDDSLWEGDIVDKLK